ncbi:hypothetical protein AHAS_Ahas11G0074700 [Arachis hypogaea]
MDSMWTLQNSKFSWIQLIFQWLGSPYMDLSWIESTFFTSIVFPIQPLEVRTQCQTNSHTVLFFYLILVTLTRSCAIC